MKCLGCGVDKDLSLLEIYPYPEDDSAECERVMCDDPIKPLIVIECSPAEKESGWRMVVVCHHCFHKLDPDMWISESCWKAINPITLFENLPEYSDSEDKWKPETYFKKEENDEVSLG